MKGFKGHIRACRGKWPILAITSSAADFQQDYFLQFPSFSRKKNICSNNFRRFLHVIVTMFSERSIFISIYAIVTMFTIFVLDPNLVRIKI